MSKENSTTRKSVYETQCRQVAGYLKKHGPLSSIDALRLFGCWRLAARIYELRKVGYVIRTETVVTKDKVFAKYHLMREPDNAAS